MPSADGGAGAPVITNVVLRPEQTPKGLVYWQDIEFQDGEGDVNLIHNELIEASTRNVFLNDLPLTPSADQRTGSTATSWWDCGIGEPYYVTVRITAVDAPGNVSNAWDIGLLCND
jgi:hypothetical protein